MAPERKISTGSRAKKGKRWEWRKQVERPNGFKESPARLFPFIKGWRCERGNVWSSVRTVLRRSRWVFRKMHMCVHMYNWISRVWQSELWNSSPLHLWVRNQCLLISSLMKGFKVWMWIQCWTILSLFMLRW
jgi:hypothetical protein